MRTTLQIDDDVLDAARAIAESEDTSLGAVISRLARCGLTPAQGIGAGGLPRFAVDHDAPPITATMVRAALDE